jgi:deazaflavin-dependent oxidoreductase (nitroreductase family)
MLCSPLHRLAGRGLLVLGVPGRRTGGLVRLPVQYADDGDRLVVVAAEASRKRWWRNLIGGAPVTVRLRGQLLDGYGRVADGDAAAAGLAAWSQRYPRVAAGLSTDLAVVVIDRLRPRGGT